MLRQCLGRQRRADTSVLRASLRRLLCRAIQEFSHFLMTVIVCIFCVCLFLYVCTLHSDISCCQGHHDYSDTGVSRPGQEVTAQEEVTRADITKRHLHSQNRI